MCHSAKRLDLSTQMFSDMLKAIRSNSRERQIQLDNYRQRQLESSVNNYDTKRGQSKSAGTAGENSLTFSSSRNLKLINIKSARNQVL